MRPYVNPASPEKPGRRFWFPGRTSSGREAYRAGAGAGIAAVGAGAVDLTTTGYFAQAARPTSEAISTSTSVVDFKCEYMNCLPLLGVWAVSVPVLLTLRALGLTGRDLVYVAGTASTGWGTRLVAMMPHELPELAAMNQVPPCKL